MFRENSYFLGEVYTFSGGGGFLTLIFGVCVNKTTNSFSTTDRTSLIRNG